MTTLDTPQDGNRLIRLLKLAGKQSSIWILLAFILIALIFTVMRPEAFATQFNWTNIAINASILLILAVGQTFVIATSGIDLSVGSVLVFASVIATQSTLTLGELLGDPESVVAVVGGLIAGLIAGALWGVFNGVLIAVAKVPPLIVTLGSMGMAMGFAQIITGGNDLRGLPTSLTQTVGSGRLFGVIPYLVIIAALIAVLSALVLNTTRFGRYTLAIGSDEEASRRNGLPVRLHLIKVYALSGLLAGLAGWLSVARFGATTINGHSAENLDTIAAVVLGGTSLFGGVASIFGTVVGVFIPTVLKNGFTIIGIEPFWQNVAVGAVLIAAVYYDQRRRKARSRR
ncbi:ABC transporter permease [Herbiconiux moechotypicola]|uniref:ABC transporter permease n=1 Tax=Herbiconiux moechotypicola TaxID=637393 RepID=A0ABN3DA52_9MICO|nr:ABC transporter permease [Herbiconiux moechotypicola]MCS5729021.1 ABC transporter permease [Herbiconiux moechotypicola]